MHADIHLQLHRLDAAELHRTASGPLPHAPAGTPVRARIGWTLVALGLRLAIPADARPARGTRRLPLAA